MKAKRSKSPDQVILEVKRGEEQLLASSPPLVSAFKIQNILVPVDFSACSKKAVQYALALAEQHEARLTLIYVVPPPSYPTGEFGGLEYGNLLVDMRVAGEKQLTTMAIDEIGDAAPCETIVRSGAPAREIVEAARELNTDIIVISTHGHTGFKHILMGSVAEHVIRMAPCPVLVVREREHEIL